MTKKIMFTDEELRTIIWAIQNQHARTTMLDLKNGKKPSEDKTIQCLNSISKKAQGELTDRYYAK